MFVQYNISHYFDLINSLATGRCGNSDWVIFKNILAIAILSIMN